MKPNTLKKLTITLTLLTNISACHSEDDTCKQLTGTWQGSVTDPHGLFGGTPAPITLKITHTKGNFFGISHTKNAIINNALNHSFSGQCVNGKLIKVYLQNSSKCGHFAPAGKITGSQLTLFLPFENAMTGTDFVVKAKRVNTSPGKVPQFKTPAPLTTCH